MIHLLFRSLGTSSVVCNVFEREYPAADLETRADELVVVRDGFSWAVALLPPVVLLARGAWVAFLAYAAIALVLLGGIGYLEINAGWALIALAAIGIIAGFEAPSLERWWLRQRGWTEVGVASGSDQQECERRFFEVWLSQQTAPQRPAEVAAVAAPVPGHDLRRLFAAAP